MRNLKISKQLIFLVIGLMIAFGAATYLQIRSSANAIYHERYEMLRTQVESGLSIIQRYYDLEKAGKLSEADAQAQAYAMVNTIKYTPDGYLFGYDYDINMVFQPIVDVQTGALQSFIQGLCRFPGGGSKN